VDPGVQEEEVGAEAGEEAGEEDEVALLLIEVVEGGDLVEDAAEVVVVAVQRAVDSEDEDVDNMYLHMPLNNDTLHDGITPHSQNKVICILGL
jgi:hypothetical protein